MAYNKYKTDNTLRKAFDTAYAAPDTVKNTYSRLPKRLLIVVISTLVLLVALAFLTSRTLNTLEEGKQPPLITRLVAPYDLSTRYLPSIDTSLIASRPIPVIDTDFFIEQRDYLASISSETVTRDSIMDIILPGVRQDFFLILPILEGYDRNFIYTIDSHPATNCIIENYRDTYVTEFACEAGPVSQFIETADYLYELPAPPVVEQQPAVVAVVAETTLEAESTAEPTPTPEPTVDPNAYLADLTPVPANHQYVRVVAAQYETIEDAKIAIKMVFNDSRKTSVMGNFAMLQELDVNYFYGYENGWYVFTWAHDSWVYSVSSQDFLQLEDMITRLPF